MDLETSGYTEIVLAAPCDDKSISSENLSQLISETVGTHKIFHTGNSRFTYFQDKSTSDGYRFESFRIYDKCVKNTAETIAVFFFKKPFCICQLDGDDSINIWLKEKYENGLDISGISESSFILTTPGRLNSYTTRYPDYYKSQFVSDRIVGALTDSDRKIVDYSEEYPADTHSSLVKLSLRAIERVLGLEIMKKVAEEIGASPPTREYKFYAPFEPNLKHGDEVILRVQKWLATQHDRPVSSVAMADRSGLPPHTFLRRFVSATSITPIEYHTRLRLARACLLLEISQLPLEAIAARTGYRDGESLRRVFGKIYGVTPAEYRRRKGLI